MADIFAGYAEYYDLLYRDKAYRAEAEYVAELVGRFAPKRKGPHKLLDLACGTGRHANELARLGFRIDGSDASPDMIRRARFGATHPGRFHEHSFQEADRIGGKYDAVLSMFSAIDYLVDHDDLVRTLRNIHGLLRRGGIFVFDYWNGNAVIRDHSPVRILRKKDGEREILRYSRTEIDLLSQLATVDFTFLCMEGDRKLAEFEERHVIRYFHFNEMENYLRQGGFEIVYRAPFLELDRAVDPYGWNVSIVAKRRDH